MNRGDIVTIATGGGFGGKPRPAVVVQADQFAALGTILVAPLTSVVAEPPFFRPRIEPNGSNGLKAPSKVMVDLLVAVRKDRVGKRLGRLDAVDLINVERALLVILGFAE